MIAITTLVFGKDSKPAPAFAGARGVAYVITPGSLHASGELYDAETLAKSDLIMPRAVSDELQRVKALGLYAYLVRVPAIGLGSITLEIGEDYTPTLRKAPSPPPPQS